MLVEVQADLKSAERIARIPLYVGANNQTLRVSDIASVSKTTLDPPRSLAFHGTQPVLFVNAKMQPGLQIEPWTEQALQVVDDLKAGLPDGIGVEIVYLQNTYTAERMMALATNLAFALILVLLVLIWMMGLRSALTVGLALPLSAGMVLIGMMYLDIPLHQMSVTGLIISLGLLIDNAIVVVEDYKLKRQRGAPIDQAIEQSIQHLWVPLGASTATTVFAFMPIALAPGGVGDFTGTLGVTVALSVASSFFSRHDHCARFRGISGTTVAIKKYRPLVAARLLQRGHERDIPTSAPGSHPPTNHWYRVSARDAAHRF